MVLLPKSHLTLHSSKKAKLLSEEALQIAEKKREAKGKGEKERYTHLLGFFCFLFSFIFISWRLITLQYCSVFRHTLT